MKEHLARYEGTCSSTAPLLTFFFNRLRRQDMDVPIIRVSSIGSSKADFLSDWHLGIHLDMRFNLVKNCIFTGLIFTAFSVLFMWNNDHIRNLMIQNSKVILPIILPSLERNAHGHWHQAVQSLTLHVKKVFCDADQAFFDECLVKYQENEVNEKELQAKRELTWKRLEELAASKSVTISKEAEIVPMFGSSLTINSDSSLHKNAS